MVRKIADGPVATTFTAENLQATYGGRLTSHLDEILLQGEKGRHRSRPEGAGVTPS